MLDWRSLQVNGATNYVLNGHVGQAEIQAVLGEFLLESGALVDSIIAKTEAQAELTDRQKAGGLKKLDSAIAAAEQVARTEALEAAHAEVERQFAGEAA
jgi:hypothetical protein